MAPMTGLNPASPVRIGLIIPDRDYAMTPAEGKEGLFESIRRLAAGRCQEVEPDGLPEGPGLERPEDIVMDLAALEAPSIPVDLPINLPRYTDSEGPGKSSAAVARNALEIHPPQHVTGPEGGIVPVKLHPAAAADSVLATAPAPAGMAAPSAGKGTPADDKVLPAASPATAAVSAAASEKPLAPATCSFGSSMEQNPSDDGKDRMTAPSIGHAVQAEHRLFAAAAMSASAIESPGEDPRVASPQIIRQIAGSMEYTPEAGVQELVIRLKPDVFGELHIRLEMKDDGISARITTDSHPTRVMLSAHLSQLQDALQEKGLSIKDIQVEFIAQQAGDTRSGQPGGDSGRRPLPYAVPAERYQADTADKPEAPAWRTERAVRAGGLDYLA